MFVSKIFMIYGRKQKKKGQHNLFFVIYQHQNHLVQMITPMNWNL